MQCVRPLRVCEAGFLCFSGNEHGVTVLNRQLQSGHWRFDMWCRSDTHTSETAALIAVPMKALIFAAWHVRFASQASVTTLSLRVIGENRTHTKQKMIGC